MRTLRPTFILAAPLVLWAWLGWQLHDEWTLNAQYNYGWSVPVLAALLFHRRWVERPTPSAPAHSGFIRAAKWLLLVLVLPLRIIGEANPDWRALSWALALVVVAFSILTVRELGGRGWVRHFTSVFCFTLVAVPWPVRQENFIIHGLTRAVAFLAVEAAGWLGVGAFQLGNVIQLAHGFVGVDEACSGLRTLQAGIMISLFFGELLTLAPRRRIALLVVGCAWVFICNVLRATALVIIAGRQGIPALEHWHDALGTALLIVGIAGIGVAAFGLSRRREPARISATAPKSGELRSTGSLAALAWIIVAFVSTEAWYRAHETALVRRPSWGLHIPENFHATPLPIAPATAEILHYNRASSAAWQSDNGTTWWAFFARWNPRRAALQLVRSHSPEICLPAVGRTFRGALPEFTYTQDNLQLPFAASEFEEGGKPLFVFVCIQADRTSGQGVDEGRSELTIASRLRAACRGERNLGQRLLEFAVSGAPDYQSAKNELLRTVGATVRSDLTD